MSYIPTLPDDILHLICEQLGAQGEFSTLYRCALAGPNFCEPALKTLYRLHDRTSLVAGQDDLEVLRQRRPGNVPTTFIRQDAERDLIIKKWALLWKSMILSTQGKTFRPYASYIRSLNLRDLESLFEESKFSTKIEKSFFDDDLALFNIRRDPPWKTTTTKNVRKLLDIEAASNLIGDALIDQAYLLEELGGHKVRQDHLAKWISNLPRLETLRIWSGTALHGGSGRAIRETCPSFRALTIFYWNDENADQNFAQFLADLLPNSLMYFETISRHLLEEQSFQALSTHHFSSLQELKLAELSESALRSLDKLSACTSLRTLALENVQSRTRFEDAESSDVFSAMVKWISSCPHLHTLDFKGLVDGPSILANVLETNPHPPLTRLTVENYAMQHASAGNFHSCLPNLSSTLTSLSLRAEGEDAMPVDLDLLVNSITQLPLLRDLYLKDLSDNFTNDHITTLAFALPNLVELWTSGSEITDKIFPALSTLRSLKTLWMYAMTQFSFRGIYDFVNSLSPIDEAYAADATSTTPTTGGNKGFWLSIMNAEVTSALTETEQSKIRKLIEEKLGGRFDFTLWRDPDDSEFEGDSD